MSKSTRKKASTAALIAACAAVHSADASLTIDMRVVSISGAGTINNSKTVTGVQNGDVINYEIHALVTGATASNSGFANGYAGIASSGAGTVQVNLTHAIASGMTGTGSNAGTPTNLGGDTDTDIGPSLNPSNNQAGTIFYRSTNGTGYSQAFDTLLGMGTMTVVDASFTSTLVSFLLPTTTTLLKNPFWVEDGVSKTRSTGTVIVNSGISIFSNNPATDTWIGSSDANWDTPGNWTHSAKPTSNDATSFNSPVPGTGSTITLSSGEQAASLSFGDNYTLTGGDLALTSGDINVAIGKTATFQSALVGNIGAQIYGGAVVFSGTSPNTYTGATTLQSGSLLLNKTGASAINGNVIVNSGLLQLLASNQIVDSASVTLNGGTFDLNNNSETVATVGGSGAVSLGSGALTVNNPTGQTFSGNISGTGSLTKAGAGAITLGSASSTFSGGVTVTGGTLVFGASSTPTSGTVTSGPIGTGILTVAGATLQSASSARTIANPVAVNGDLTFGGSNSNNNVTLTGNIALNATSTMTVSSGVIASINGNITGASGITKAGSGTLILGGNNGYIGGTTVSAGTLQVNTSAIPGNVVNNASVVFDQTTAGSYNGAISGTGSLTKNSTGTLILAAANTYAGGTTVNQGSLVVNNNSGSSGTGSGAVMVSSLATVGGTGTIGGSLTDSGKISPATPGTAGTLHLGLGLTLNEAASFDFDMSGPSRDFVSITGSLHLPASNNSVFINLFDIGNGAAGGTFPLITYTGTLDGNFGSFQIATHPAAGTYTIVNNPHSVDLLITNAHRNLVWSGGGSGSGPWDINTTANWSNGASLTTFQNDDAVTFDDTANATPGTFTVTVAAGGVGPSAITFNNNSNTYIINGAGISDSPGAVTSLVKNGTGSVTLNNSNTFSGSTTINAGTLAIGSAAAIGSTSGVTITGNASLKALSTLSTDRPITLGSGGGTLDSGSNTFTVAAISGPGALTKTGVGTLILTLLPTNTGGATVAAGTLQGTPAVLPAAITNNATVAIDTPVADTFSGAITGSGTVQKINTAKLTIGSSAHLSPTGPLSIVQGPIDFVGPSLTVGPLTTQNGGELRVAASQTVNIGSGASSNAGKIELIGSPSGSSQIEFTGPLTNAASTGMINVRDNTTLRFDSGLTNNGAVAIAFAQSNVNGNINNNASGNITISGNSNVVFNDDIVNNGTMTCFSGSTAVFFGSLSGANGVTGGGTVEIAGDLRPGNSPAAVNFGGNLEFGPAANLAIEIAGVYPGALFDQLNVANSLLTDGTLNVILLDGFSPSVGDSFDILNFATLSGTFHLNLPDLGPGRVWDTSNLYTTGVLAVAVPEPASLALCALSPAFLFPRRRRRD